MLPVIKNINKATDNEYYSIQDAIDDDADSSDDIERNHALEAIEHYCIEHHEGDKSANQRMCAFRGYRS